MRRPGKVLIAWCSPIPHHHFRWVRFGGKFPCVSVFSGCFSCVSQAPASYFESPKRLFPTGERPILLMIFTAPRRSQRLEPPRRGTYKKAVINCSICDLCHASYPLWPGFFSACNPCKPYIGLTCVRACLVCEIHLFRMVSRMAG